MAKAMPGSFGLPLLGETLSLFADPLTFFARRQQKYGPVFKTHILGKPSAVLFGAHAQQQVFLASGEETPFRSRDGYSFAEPFLGSSLLQMDGLVHQTQRKLITPAFQSHNYTDYLARINRAYDQVVATWPDQGTRVFYQDARTIAFRVSASLMLGVEDHTTLTDLNTLIHTLFEGPMSPVRLNLPFTKYGKALAVKPLIDSRLQEIIDQHRAHPTSDVLSLFLQARDEDGQPLTDEQLIAHLKLLLFAGYDTTTTTLAWSLLELLSHPDLYEQVRAEVKAEEVESAKPVTVEDLRTMPLLDAFLKETLRLHPIAAFLLRGVRATFEFEDYAIPAGWQLILPISFTHRSPAYFANPEQFDPQRFLAPREEDKKTPYAWLAFGGGKHMCLGMGIAQIEMKTVLTRLLRQFDLQLVPGQDISPNYIPVNRPKGGAVISFQRRFTRSSSSTLVEAK
ncbi:cytochrome P450 [Dictyobacter kobayashii]|uniref:Cytochrome P450 n=1 Tax=Dictyobacter kobayashii TaxID=2014872 RepID=A0A402ANN7_9CHLR|nr:cytochrome P450 [Dictyobacter kobayashii]GCE20639.1 cytochrome P450 [Dictyobacter kobayashii]